jgi:ATP-dependent Clp protease ATP-binding subunit ClpA
VDQCINSSKGARILDRIIDVDVKKQIADSLLFGVLKNGGEVSITYSDLGVQFEFCATKLVSNNEIV